MIRREDIIFKEPTFGDLVLFLKWDVKRAKSTTDVGIVGRIYAGNDKIVVSGTPRDRRSILFVLTQKGYNKQQISQCSSICNDSNLKSKFLQ